MKNLRGYVFGAVVLVSAILVLAVSSKLVSTNEDGHFEIKQAFVTGDMSVRSDAGTYWQGYGKITTYHNVATVGMGDKNNGDGRANISAIPVIFNDGSKADISGIIRVELPKMDTQRLALKQEYPSGYNHFIEAGIVPIVSNAVKLSANLRSAQDAYTSLATFQQAIEDQLMYGTYKTKSVRKEVINESGEKEMKQITVPVSDEFGNPVRVPNRLQELGCKVVGCVIDVPAFDAKVEESISNRKDEAMKTELAKQEALRAEQDALKAEAVGKAKAAEAKWRQEEVNAGEIAKAEKALRVAELAAKEAAQQKLRDIAIAEAEAEKARLLVKAGLSPQEQAEWDYKTAVGVAKEIFGGKGISFPDVMVTGVDSKGGAVDPFTAVGLESLKGMVNGGTKKK